MFLRGLFAEVAHDHQANWPLRLVDEAAGDSRRSFTRAGRFRGLLRRQRTFTASQPKPRGGTSLSSLQRAFVSLSPTDHLWRAHPRSEEETPRDLLTEADDD